ncbi:unnamed protein product [Meganyctiphanes norvegica]|uniref:XK-related protein n=1 Tax=Meganyctiphanes norvegica TaxID=48144 RepID=A0AAV2PN11_MEGNR
MNRIYKVIQPSDDSVPCKIFLVTIEILISPFRPFYLVVANAFACCRGHVKADARRTLGLIKLLESILESFPQLCLQLFAIVVNETEKAESWQLLCVITSVITFTFTVSTNPFLFNKTPKNTKTVFFFFGFISVSSRLVVFFGYLTHGWTCNMNSLCFLHMGTMLAVSIIIWLIKRQCHDFGSMVPLADAVHRRSNMWGVVVIFWLLTATYNTFTWAGLLLSTINLAFVLVLGVRVYSIEAAPALNPHFFIIMFILPATLSFIANVVFLAVPRFRHVGKQWMNIDEYGASMLY